MHLLANVLRLIRATSTRIFWRVCSRKFVMCFAPCALLSFGDEIKFNMHDVLNVSELHVLSLLKFVFENQSVII